MEGTEHFQALNTNLQNHNYTKQQWVGRDSLANNFSQNVCQVLNEGDDIRCCEGASHSHYHEPPWTLFQLVIINHILTKYWVSADPLQTLTLASLLFPTIVTGNWRTFSVTYSTFLPPVGDLQKIKYAMLVACVMEQKKDCCFFFSDYKLIFTNHKAWILQQ